ncbi:MULTISPECIES: aromatic ring-hydroxylating dioxygenase subunit alpha [unclassified Beijerinckia]|uniref:aromatic ring-hydroxylating dioxygenase subunit alpha n=1 Tax=unclassified Beijerinckia TaxID=2638183 RepID=UPI0008962CF7|nr:MULTISPECIES: aromatic ring-hydroxylating dioxygenase subunit alpha [unclassified Beijerinckia]MDH7799021.1 phenylpropionate dioxygenase-like ring-hydroxylating dioxygenase large terminal subunit [Beijerinckia sp. GAS462]SED84108.1 vanillate O-demethylase monooxygenase subunit [Beijerinckia sp. 28-YEA-48]
MIIDNVSNYYPGTLPAPRNAWYVAAFSDEVTEKPMARRILGDRVVFYRTEAGQPVALADYCAHRAMALSLGKRIGGDRLQCAYHGIEYGPDGACAHIPSQSNIPSKMKVHSYPVVERWQWLWVWMGNPLEADETLIPNHAEFGLAPEDGFFKVQRFRMDFGGSFQLLHENVLDVSHISFLHEGFFDSGKIAETPGTTTADGDTITISRRITEVVTGPYARQFGFGDGTRVDRELISKTWVPNLNVVTNIFSFPDNPDRSPAIRHAPFAITPETATSCHYFVASASNYGKKPEGEALARENQTVWDIFLTDKIAIESIQESYGEMGADTPDVSVKADDAALRFRRILLKQASAKANKANAA